MYAQASTKMGTWLLSLATWFRNFVVGCGPELKTIVVGQFEATWRTISSWNDERSQGPLLVLQVALPLTVAVFEKDLSTVSCSGK
jgi:hypothetical protein